MSPAREEVIETVRDYKTSKHGEGCRPLKKAEVTAVPGTVWEKSKENVNKMTPFELLYCTLCSTLSFLWENLTQG